MRKRTQATVSSRLVLNNDMDAVLRVMLKHPIGTRFWGVELAEQAKVRRSEIYDYVHTFEAWGWIRGERETINARDRKRPPRTMYEFTEAGRAHAQQAVEGHQPVAIKAEEPSATWLPVPWPVDVSTVMPTRPIPRPSGG